MARKAVGAAAPKRVNLALQGGGAHGAFAWGVLERPLEDERIAVEAVSATSAGAMNAAEAEDAFGELGVSAKLNPDWNFVTYLFEIGRERCDRWLAENYDKIGSESSIDLRERFL